MVLGKKNKKGFIFTLLVIIMLYILLVSYGIYSIDSDESSVRRRVESLDSFVFSVEEDLERQVYTAGFRIIFLMVNQIINETEYISDVDSFFQEAFLDGTVDSEVEPLMVDATIDDIIDFLKERAERVNADANFSNVVATISQDNPWFVRVSLSGNLEIWDKGGIVSFNRTQEIVAQIPISSFEDPLYIVETNREVANVFNQTIYEPFVSGNDVSNLMEHLNGSFYIHSTIAPSFLDRLEGDLNARSPQGIESLVYSPRLSDAGISTEVKSNVDFIYFSSNNPTEYSISGSSYNWFRLDDQDNRLSLYGVEHLAS